MPQPQTATSEMNDHLKRIGAEDLAGVASSKHIQSIGRLQSQSTKNPSVGILIEDGKRHIMYGLGDPNFAPARLTYDDKGKLESVQINNSDRSGHVTYKAAAPVVEAILKAAASKPQGRGYAVAALAKAANATDKFGNSNWGVGLIASAQDKDTKNLSSTHLAIAALQAKWQQFVKPYETPKLTQQKPQAQKPPAR